MISQVHTQQTKMIIYRFLKFIFICHMTHVGQVGERLVVTMLWCLNAHLQSYSAYLPTEVSVYLWIMSLFILFALLFLYILYL